MLRNIALFAILLIGCAMTRAHVTDIGDGHRTPEEAFNDRWTGKPEDDVLVQYGKPFEVVQLSNGNHLNSYHREIVVSTSSSRGAFGAYGGGHRAQSDSTTIYCDRRFEIDNATLRVVRAIITGSRCDFSQ